MSQSRFSIVLVGVSALLRRPLVSRLRPAEGERSPWVVFAARGGRFDSGFRSASWPSGSPLPLFGMHRFGNSPRRVGLRVHCFRFSARTASEIALGGLAFGLTASAFRHAPLRKLPSAGWPSGSLLPLFGMRRFGVATGRVRSSAFRFGDYRWAGWFFRSVVGLRVHCFRFSACANSEWPLGGLVLPPSASELPSAGWPSGSPLPLFGMHRFGVAAGRIGSSAFRFGDCRRAGWPSGSLLPLFGTHRFGVAAGRVRSSAFRFGDCPRRVGLRAHCFRFSVRTDPHRRTAEARTDGAHRHDNCFTSKHLSQHVNLPHRTP